MEKNGKLGPEEQVAVPVKIIGSAKDGQIVVDFILFLCGEGTCLLEEKRVVVPIVVTDSGESESIEVTF